MKPSIAQSVLIAIAALSFSSVVNASLLVGFHNFDFSSNSQTTTSMSNPNDVGFAQSGFSGTVTKPQASVGNTGSSDGSFGSYPGIVAPSDDGAGRIATGNISFALKKIAPVGGLTMLGTLFFDVARGGSGGTVNVSYEIRNTLNSLVSSGSVGSNLPINSDFNTNGGDWRDYALDLTGISGGLNLLTGHTITFLVSGPSTFRIDNVAISAIPEPASLLALGCVLGSGLLLRNRRRPVGPLSA